MARSSVLVLCVAVMSSLAFAQSVDDGRGAHIAQVRQTSASQLDSSLPRVAFGDWLNQQLGCDATISWAVRTGNEPGQGLPWVEVDIAIRGREPGLALMISTGPRDGKAAKPRFHSLELVMKDHDIVEWRHLHDLPRAMKRLRAETAPLMFVIPAANAQKQDKQRLQVFPFEHTVSLPPEILLVMRTDEQNKQRFDSCKVRRKPQEMPANWFVASEAPLSRDEQPGIVVTTGNACLRGATVGTFWVFRHRDEGYELVLKDDAADLTLLPTATNAFADIVVETRLFKVVAWREYKFNEGKYQLADKGVGHCVAPIYDALKLTCE